MLQSTNNNLPAGAIGVYGSTINQSWAPPMTAQDEMIDILTEAYTANIKRTFAGIGINGAMKMNDVDADFDMTDTWTIFGDPSLVVRTLSPMPMTVSHMLSLPVGTTDFTVDCNVNGAYVALTKDNVILATGYVSGGSVSFTLPSSLAVGDHVNVCATEYNYTPYVGEFEVINNNIPNDASVNAIMQPTGNYSCTGINTTPGAVITNMGINNLTSCTVSLHIDGTLIQSVNWTGDLATFGRDTVIFSPVAIQTGTHTVMVETSLPNGLVDGYVLNDQKTTSYTAQDLVITAAFTASVTTSCAAPLTVTFANQSQNASGYLWDFGDGATATVNSPVHVYSQPGVYTVSLVSDGGVCGSISEIKPAFITIGAESPVGTGDAVCQNTAASLTATGTGIITWYDAQTGGNVLGTGNTYNIASVPSNTTVYAENSVIGAAYNVGPTNNTTNGSVFTAATEHYEIFSVTEACRLVSVSVNAQGAGNRTVSLRNSAGTTLQSIVVNMPDGVSRVTLNFDLMPGTDYRLVGQATPNLYRSNAGLSYPYTINNVLSITGSSASTSPQGYYYYYYDWEVKMPDCISARIPVVAEVSQPVISIISTPPSSISTADGSAEIIYTSGLLPVSYLWSDGQTDATATGLVSGNYSVTITDEDGCATVFNCFVDYPVGVNTAESKIVSVYPVPASEYLKVKAENILITRIDILDVSGRVVLQMDIQNVSECKIDLSTLSPGSYLLKVFSDEEMLLKRIAVQK
jgi:PKD repeat protein